MTDVKWITVDDDTSFTIPVFDGRPEDAHRYLEPGTYPCHAWINHDRYGFSEDAVPATLTVEDGRPHVRLEP